MNGDIHPRTPVAALNKNFKTSELDRRFDVSVVSALVGMSATFVATALQTSAKTISLRDVLGLLEQDAFAETFVPRSRVPKYLLERRQGAAPTLKISDANEMFFAGNAMDLIPSLPNGSVACVVTSTPYWGTRLYNSNYSHKWGDGEHCPLGNEQTPEGFVRHTVEILFMLKQALAEHGSIWWNLMDSYNTRTQIRSNASETLNAMRGGDSRSWHDHERRRYSAGHAYLKDGEQSQIPAQVAARASRIGYYLKSTIAWKKSVSMPEPVESRVTRELEFILHLSVCRTPFFDKKAFRELPERLGGRNRRFESDKVTDVWTLPTANGLDGHGAQFPVALPGRCIALSTKPGDIVLDPFVGSGTTSVAAALLRRRSIGFDVSEAYLTIAKRRVSKSLNRPAKSSYHQEYDNDNSELFQLT